MGLMAVASYAGVAYSAINASSLGSAAFKLAAAYALNNIYAPDSSFEKDPSKSQGKESKIFNNATVIREQGGSVPIIYGNPYCGGVLISSSISSEDVKK
jgi:predicted phage tail protein